MPFLPPLRATPRLAFGAMLVAVIIYGLNFGVTRLATQSGLAPADLAALRFGVAGFLLLPLFLRAGVSNCAGLGWRRGLILAITGGVVVAILMNTGLSLAPAAHGAAMGPGIVTTIGILAGILASRRAPPVRVWIGLCGILLGLVAVALSGSLSGSANVLLGDLCFLSMGLLWGFYPVLLHAWRVEPMTGTTVVSVLALAYLPIYAAFERSRLLDVPLGLVAFQAVFQGVFSVIVGLWLWGFAVKTLGAARTQFFPPLIPVLGTLFAIPILGEIPRPMQWVGLALIVGGIVLAATAAPRPPAVEAELS